MPKKDEYGTHGNLKRSLVDETAGTGHPSNGD
jgi:hypothetical protein